MHYLLSHDSSLCVNDAPRGGMGGGGGGGLQCGKVGCLSCYSGMVVTDLGLATIGTKEDFLLRKECFNEL